jgi:iron complex outermembrane receptor protein
MNNSMNMPPNRREMRWKLLSTVSAIALMASIYGTERANATGSDENRPTLWIELGGQAEAIAGQGEPFTAHFITANASSPAFDPLSPLSAQKPPQFSFGEDGKISFQPEGSNWIFSASIRYGRSGNNRNIHQQTPGVKVPTTTIQYRYFEHPYNKTAVVDNYAQYRIQHSESHAVLDFQAGKDVGIGLFGNNGTSVFSAGVRIVRFDSKATADMHARPDLAVYGPDPAKYWNNFHLTGQSERSFRGIGPTISWNGSAAMSGNPTDGELTVDWGANVGVLFGRQWATIKHATSDDVLKFDSSKYLVPVYNHSTPVPQRARSVTVPNLGGFAGISYRFDSAALSIGYRADYFFGAVDGGIDTTKKTTLGFKGPFASISVGVGD